MAKNLKNQRIRAAVKEGGFCLWQVADVLGISDWRLSRRLRYELTPEQEAEILQALETLKKGEYRREAE